MLSPYLLQATALAGRVDELRAEAQRERRSQAARRGGGRLTTLRQMAARAIGTGWPTAAPIPGLHDYPYATAGR